MYFSFVTLTTVGFGDVVPVDPVARAAMILEALIGQFYLVVLVARLVGMHIVDMRR
jgi:voltage-gated potassium channel Kch